MCSMVVRLRVLGQLAGDVDGRAVDLGGPRQRAVLALLLTARRAVVPSDRMIDDVWRGEPPPRATGSLQTYVSNLRRLLEPGRSPRARTGLLASAPPGYALRLAEDAVDAWQFEGLVREALAVRTSDPEQARRILGEALGLWQGPAYAEFADEPWAAAEAARLEELRLLATESLIEVTLRAGSPGEAVPLADVLTREQPLREEGWRLLALALWGSGRPADALAALRRARRTFAAELGLDSGPGLAALERDILASRTQALRAAVGRDAAPDRPAPVAGGEPDPLFVGRDAELDLLAGVAGEVRAGAARVVLVSGEAGVGKSSLLARLCRRLGSDGWLVAAGRCPEHDGAPPAWTWVQALRRLAGQTSPGEFAGALAPLLEPAGMPAPQPDPPAGRFRLRRAVCAWLRAAAESRPLAVVLDDLHAADAETLALLIGVAEEVVDAPVLLVAAYRPTDAGDRLPEVLGALARRSPLRLPLAGLMLSDVDMLVRALHDGPVDAATVEALAERTGGNPFYLRESIRLLAAEGALVATSEVPEGVRDVLRRRLARLSPATVNVLRVAAVAGLEADVDLVVRVAEADEPGVLEALEAGLAAGLLSEPVPGTVRFVHALVRDTVYTDLPPMRRIRMHARVAEALARLRPDDAPALAHHYARAGSADTAALAVRYAVAAADLAERRYAHDSAVALLGQALDCHERVPAGPGDRDAERIDLLGRLLRAQVRAGAVAAARATRDRAVELAGRAGRGDLLIEAFAAWTEPTPWTARPYGTVDERVVGPLTRLLRRTDLDPATRCRLLAALVMELAGEGDPRAAQAAAEAVALATRAGDPALLALALSEQAREASWDREPDRRADLAERIGQLGAEHDLVAYRWHAEYIAATAAAARGEPATLRQHVDRGLRLAQTYGLAEPLAVGLCSQAMLAHIGGRFDEGERFYAEASAQLERHGSPHAAGFGVLAVFTIRASQHRLAEFAPAAAALHAQFGPLAVDPSAAALAVAGRRDEARKVLSDPPPLRPDFYFSVFATLRAIAAVALGNRELAEDLYAALSPVADQLAGAASTSLALRPIAHTLGELALVLGRTAAAAEHLAAAVDVAAAWQAPVWRSDAARALAALRAGRV
jgi:DNA-binding SARP family transcriptional activator